MDNVLFGGMSFSADNKFVIVGYTIKNLDINGSIEIPMDDYTNAISVSGLDGMKKYVVDTLQKKLSELLQSMEIEGK